MQGLLKYPETKIYIWDILLIDKIPKVVYPSSMQNEFNMTLSDKNLRDIEAYINRMAIQVGEFINEHRKKNRLTIAELAKRSKVSSTVITDLENGRSLPRTEVLLKLAYSLSIPFEVIFSKFALDKGFILNHEPDRGMSEPSLEDMLKREGLGGLDVKDVLQYIGFKKYVNSNRR